MELPVLLLEDRLQLEQSLALVRAFLVNLVYFLHFLIIEYHLLVVFFLRMFAGMASSLWRVQAGVVLLLLFAFDALALF